MSTPSDKRLIEEYLPIEAISLEASREKSVRKGHISTLHLWWARRPLVACRAVVYGALVPSSRFVPNGAADEKKKSLGRANAAKFVERLCKYPGDSKVIHEAQCHIFEAHAERLTRETGRRVTVEDIQAGRAPRPKVLDMFAGGGAIPLEALRLGCESFANDLNPVAHIIELCTLVYPQQYGKPDPESPGATGPTGRDSRPTWGGLAEEVRYWGRWVLKKVKAEIGDLYPLIPDPAYQNKPGQNGPKLFKDSDKVQPGFLTPVAYLWTRTVTCKNPTCKANVPLVKQTWLCKKTGRYVALKGVALKGEKRVRFLVVESVTRGGLGFDPEMGSKGGNATCLFCGTVADSEYVMAEGVSKRMGQQMMAAVCLREGRTGRLFISADDYPGIIPDDASIRRRIDTIKSRTGLSVPNEVINPVRPSPNSRGLSPVTRYGLLEFGDLFNYRQQYCLITFASQVRAAFDELVERVPRDRAIAIATYLSLVLDRLADWNSSFCAWSPESTGGAKIGHTFGRQALPMIWDYVESAVWGEATGSADLCLDWVIKGLMESAISDSVPKVARGSATSLPWPDATFDAVITDPPYYDNVPYADISDFFYVWIKRSIGHLYPEHFSSELTPKKMEATALASRHKGNVAKANQEYEAMMAASFKETYRVLKHNGQFVIVYAHKTTLGWATLVDAIRRAGFVVAEAWPLDTEMKARMVALDAAALATSIFLTARKGDVTSSGSYELDVRPELETIVRERVQTLWDQGISGADLVIACVGAGLRAFTRYARVEFANGEEVPAERFLSEVETVVLDTILGRLSKEVRGKGDGTSLAGVDPSTRFYTLWRYTYRGAELDGGEAIVFANGTHVELDGPSGLTSGARALVEKTKGKYRLRDFAERGKDEALGRPDDHGQPAPLIDALHRTLWLMENRPLELAEFLREAEPNREQMRLVAQALAGPALKGGEMADISPTAELAALGKLTANWRSVVEDHAVARPEQADREHGQRMMFE